MRDKQAELGEKFEVLGSLIKTILDTIDKNFKDEPARDEALVNLLYVLFSIRLATLEKTSERISFVKYFAKTAERLNWSIYRMIDKRGGEECTRK